MVDVVLEERQLGGGGLGVLFELLEFILSVAELKFCPRLGSIFFLDKKG